MKMFGYCSQTTQAVVEVALRCAAVSANHPDPKRFGKGWKLVSPLMEALVSPAVAAMGVRALSHVSTSTHEDTFFIRALEAIKSAETIALDPVLVLDVPWYLATRWLGQLDPESDGLPSIRAHIKRSLLATIHGFYMDALDRLPKVELQSCYHHSLLIGGYCYGPFDPLSNILLNTIWYKQKFPPIKKIEISMISTNLLWSIVARSLYGPISFLCTLLKSITPDQAMESLLISNIYLPAAIDYLSIGPTSTTSLFDVSLAPPLPASIADAYAAAGAAAFHHSPLAQSQFLSSEIIDAAFVSFPQHYRDGCPLSSDDISSVCRILESCSSSSGTSQQKDVTPTKVKKRVYANMSHCTDSFWGQHDRVTSMVRDALD